MSDQQQGQSRRQSGGQKHTRLQVSRCTSCHASVLYLWLQLSPRTWRAEMKPCEHVDLEALTTWRYTKREDRPKLGLPIADLGAGVRRPDPIVPGVRAGQYRAGVPARRRKRSTSG